MCLAAVAGSAAAAGTELEKDCGLSAASAQKAAAEHLAGLAACSSGRDSAASVSGSSSECCCKSSIAGSRPPASRRDRSEHPGCSPCSDLAASPSEQQLGLLFLRGPGSPALPAFE